MIDAGLSIDDKVNNIKEQLKTLDRLSMEEEQLKEVVSSEDINEEKSGLSI